MKYTLRRIIEKVLRNTSFKRWLPEAFGNTPLYISPDSQLKYIKPGRVGFDCDELLLNLADRFVHKSDVIWDVGANVGIFAFAAAGKGGRILAVEPDPFLVELLRKSARIKENHDLDVKVVPVALSSNNALEVFHIAERGRASNTLALAGGRSQMGGIREEIIVPVMTMDALLEVFPCPKFVKIDVEGSEILVMAGGKRVLEEVRPIFFIEADIKTRPGITTICREHDYALFEDIGSYDANIEIEGVIKQKDTLCIPREKLEQIRNNPC
jgi:FkbM family methyltransferase